LCANLDAQNGIVESEKTDFGDLYAQDQIENQKLDHIGDLYLY